MHCPPPSWFWIFCAQFQYAVRSSLALDVPAHPHMKKSRPVSRTAEEPDLLSNSFISAEGKAFRSFDRSNRAGHSLRPFPHLFLSLALCSSLGCVRQRFLLSLSLSGSFCLSHVSLPSIVFFSHFSQYPSPRGHIPPRDFPPPNDRSLHLPLSLSIYLLFSEWQIAPSLSLHGLPLEHRISVPLPLSFSPSLCSVCLCVFCSSVYQVCLLVCRLCPPLSLSPSFGLWWVAHLCRITYIVEFGRA